MSFDVKSARMVADQGLSLGAGKMDGLAAAHLARGLRDACDEIERLRAENEELSMRMYEECVPKRAANEQIAKDQEIMRKWFTEEAAEKTLEIERLRANAFCARSAIDWCIGYAASVPEPDALRRQLRSARAHLTDDAEDAT